MQNRAFAKDQRAHFVQSLHDIPGATIDHFTVVRLVAWPLNESEGGDDLVLIETSLLFSC